MTPIVLFSIQFTMIFIGYALIAYWYVAPRLSTLPTQRAVVPLVWVHAFRVVGGTVLAPGAVGAGVPLEFQRMVGIGDLVTAGLALVALVALRYRSTLALALVWLVVVVGMVDTVSAIIQSLVNNVFVQPLGVNWLIVTAYVPALIVSSVLIVIYLLRPGPDHRVVAERVA
jgi:hypothetical protein